MSKDQTIEEPDAAKVARPVLKSGGRSDPFVDFNLLALRAWGVPGLTLCGAALTDVVLRLLGRWARLYLVLDDDDTGRKATARLQAVFGPRAIPVRLPPGIKDPAVLAPRPDGETLFSAAIWAAFGRHLATPAEVASEAPQRCAVGA